MRYCKMLQGTAVLYLQKGSLGDNGGFLRCIDQPFLGNPFWVIQLVYYFSYLGSLCHALLAVNSEFIFTFLKNEGPMEMLCFCS